MFRSHESLLTFAMYHHGKHSNQINAERSLVSLNMTCSHIIKCTSVEEYVLLLCMATGHIRNIYAVFYDYMAYVEINQRTIIVVCTCCIV